MARIRKPEEGWAEDWRLGLDATREDSVSRELIQIFASFWESEGLQEKSKTTQARYEGGLHALGGYLVNQAVTTDEEGSTVRELLEENLNDVDGPLIYHEEADWGWQRELDTVCRRLYRYLIREGVLG